MIDSKKHRFFFHFFCLFKFLHYLCNTKIENEISDNKYCSRKRRGTFGQKSEVRMVTNYSVCYNKSTENLSHHNGERFFL
jgi:hypothetical protein